MFEQELKPEVDQAAASWTWLVEAAAGVLLLIGTGVAVHYYAPVASSNDLQKSGHRAEPAASATQDRAGHAGYGPEPLPQFHLLCLWIYQVGFPNQPPRLRARVSGTGFVVASGLLATNRHVAEPWYGDPEADASFAGAPSQPWRSWSHSSPARQRPMRSRPRSSPPTATWPFCNLEFTPLTRHPDPRRARRRRPRRPAEAHAGAHQPAGDAPVARRRDAHGEGATPGGRAMLDALVSARLVSAEGTTVAFVHDAAILAWRRLATWIREARAERELTPSSRRRRRAGAPIASASSCGPRGASARPRSCSSPASSPRAPRCSRSCARHAAPTCAASRGA